MSKELETLWGQYNTMKHVIETMENDGVMFKIHAATGEIIDVAEIMDESSYMESMKANFWCYMMNLRRQIMDLVTDDDTEIMKVLEAEDAENTIEL